jgi:hypothetical protein
MLSQALPHNPLPIQTSHTDTLEVEVEVEVEVV